MANDIGAFFATEDNETLAAASIHQHIQRYWDGRMKARMVEHFNETNGAGLEGAVRAAVRKLAEERTAVKS
jgi:formate dehydrogenase subunit delta